MIMNSCACRSAIFYFFAFFWLLAAVMPVFSRGNQDPDLSRADSLINERRHDEAILILTEFARNNPDRFDLAQQRFRRIFQSRDEFNRTANELLYTIVNDPDNSEKILALSNRLRDLEEEGSDIFESFIYSKHGIAQFNVDRNQLRIILEEGREWLDRGDSAAALATYARGIDLMRDPFFTAGYGDTIENEVRQNIENVNSTLNAFYSTGSPLAALAAELIQALNAGNLTAVPEILSRLNPAMDRFIALKQELYTSANTFDRILEQLQREDPEMGDRNYMAFLSRLIHGRPGQFQEGMLGSFDLYWTNTILPVVSAITRNAERANTLAQTEFNAENYSNSIAAVDLSAQYISISPLFFEKHRQLHENGKFPQLLMFGNYVTQPDVPSFANLRSLGEAGVFLRQAADLSGQMYAIVNTEYPYFTLWEQGNITTPVALNYEQQARNVIYGMQGSFENIISNAVQMDNLISVFYNTVHIKNALDLLHTMHAAVIEEVRQSAHRYYTIADSELKQNLQDRMADMERGRNFLNGHSREIADGTVVVDRFPSEATEVFTVMLSALSENLRFGDSVMVSYGNEPSEVISDDFIIVTHNSIQGTINELNNLRNQGLSMANTARAQTAQAEALRRDGERLFAEAQAAYQRQNFDIARERLQRAADRFNNSLEIQESASSRQNWDAQTLRLGQAINVAENEIIIVDVRNLVNSARNSYFAGDFQQAEDSLIRARNRWRLTNVTENQEIQHWLGIVRGAMSARSGRVIPSTAPLFPEMSQLLSQAQRNFEDGVRFINAGQRSNGLARFDEALALTREVRLLFPLNQDAGILELRIEQFTDPAGFNAAFEQRLRTAIIGTRQRSIESFADLQNLAEINPGYPGIRGIITQAEIDMGFRPPPPNPRDLARSRELTVSASRILDGNVLTLFEVALSQVNEAITLDPSNMEATRVKDRLLNRMSVPGAVVLSTEDEVEYQRAVRELQAGNNLVALAVVERLMQNPRNRNITKLVELQRRIQSVL
jgi:tetratricopeptide (TPR) repeat protein